MSDLLSQALEDLADKDLRIEELKAELAVVKLERDQARWAAKQNQITADRVTARLTEVEAERDRLLSTEATEFVEAQGEADDNWQRAEAAEARLAAVEALCDDLDGYLTWCDGLIPGRKPRPENVRAFVGKLRAAARGEGDRPGERSGYPYCAGCDHGDPAPAAHTNPAGCVYLHGLTHPIHGGEDDRG